MLSETIQSFQNRYYTSSPSATSSSIRPTWENSSSSEIVDDSDYHQYEKYIHKRSYESAQLGGEQPMSKFRKLLSARMPASAEESAGKFVRAPAPIFNVS